MAAPTPATKTKVVRVSVYIRRKAGMSQEEFNHYWSHVHGPVVRPLLEKMGFLKYTQYHTSSSLKEASISILPELTQAKPLDYDGVAEFIVPDVSYIKSSREDPYFFEKVLPDEERFFDTQNTGYHIGWEEVYLRDGKIVDLEEARVNSQA